MQEQEQKQLTKSQKNATYKRHYACVLTKPEGETLDTILTEFDCSNLSQLCKKIVKGKLSLERNF